MTPAQKVQTLKEYSEVLNSKTGGRFSDFCTANNLCPECLGSLLTRNGESACSQCGLVVEREVPKETWIGDDHMTVHKLAFGNNTGNSLQRKGLFRVLARDGNQVAHLPIRSKTVAVETIRFEHPQVAYMLAIGSQLCEVYGFEKHGVSKNLIFTNKLGKIIRTVGSYITYANMRFPLAVITRACFLLAFNYTKADRAPDQQELGVPTLLLYKTQRIYEERNLLQQKYPNQ